MAIACVLVFCAGLIYGGLWGGLLVRVAMRAGLDTGLASLFRLPLVRGRDPRF